MQLSHPRCVRARRLATPTLALVLLAFGAGSGAQAAGPSAWDSAEPLQLIAQAQPGQATQLQSVTYGESGAGIFTNVGDTSSNVRYSSPAYDPGDGYLYAVVQAVADPAQPTSPAGLAPGDLIRIGQGGTVALVAPVAGAASAADAASGAYDTVTNQYLVWGSGASVSSVDTQTGASVPVCDLARPVKVGAGAFQGGFLWTLARDTTGASLARIDLTPQNGTCRVKRIPVSGVVLGQHGGQFGAAWAVGNGALEFSDRRSGQLIQLQVSATGAVSDVVSRDGPPNRASGGAAVTGAPVSLAVTQAPGVFSQKTGVATWAVSITNNGPADALNWSLADTLPAGATFASATFSDGTAATCAPSGAAAITCQAGSLPAHASATLSVAAHTASKPTCLTNRVTVGAPSQADTGGAAETATSAPLCRTHAPAANGPGLVVTKTSAPASGTEVSAGEVVTYTLTFQNTGSATATVAYTDFAADVLDDAAVVTQPAADDPSWTVGAIGPGGLFAMQGTVAPGATVTVTYAVQVLPDGQRGNGLLVNYLTPSTQSPPPECVPGNPLCTRNPTAGAPDVVVTKTADPASGTVVTGGQAITYTLTFENLGLGPAAVSYTDFAAGVLDDATMTTPPTANDSSWTVGAVGSNDSFPIAGTLAPGATTKVTYAVKVLPEVQRHNGVLSNFLAPSNLPPPSECLPQNPLCTQHLTPLTPDLQVAKSASPASGTLVKPAQTIAYTLTFHNAGLATAHVAYTDDARNLVDDASVTAQPAADDPSWKVGKLGSSGTFSMGGSVAPRSTVHVTYRVKVLPNNRKRNGYLVNFLTPTGTKPPTGCAATDPLCTRHFSPIKQLPLPQTGNVTPASGDTTGLTVPVVGTLPDTGLNVIGGVLAAAALVGGGVLIRRRRARG